MAVNYFQFPQDFSSEAVAVVVSVVVDITLGFWNVVVALDFLSPDKI